MNTSVELQGYPEDLHPKRIRGQVAQEMAIRHEIGQILAYKMLPNELHIQEPIFAGPFQEVGYCEHSQNVHYEIQFAYLPDPDRGYLPVECAKTIARFLLLRLVNPNQYAEELAHVLCLVPKVSQEKWGGMLSIASAVRVNVMCACKTCVPDVSNSFVFALSRADTIMPTNAILKAFDDHWVHEKQQAPDTFAPGVAHNERPFFSP